MITDHLDHYYFYLGVLPELEEVFCLAKRAVEESLPVGTYELGENFAFVQEGELKDHAEADFEAHRKYIDVQILLEGEEQMECADIRDLAEKISYSEDRDIGFMTGEGWTLSMRPGQFAVFFPHDAHKPGWGWKPGGKFKKLVAKIKVSYQD